MMQLMVHVATVCHMLSGVRQLHPLLVIDLSFRRHGLKRCLLIASRLQVLLHKWLAAGLCARSHWARVLLGCLLDLRLVCGARGPLVRLERLLDQLLLRGRVVLTGLHLFNHPLELDLHLVLLQVLLLE